MFNRRELLRGAVVGVLGMATTALLQPQQARAQAPGPVALNRPNIVLIMADDMGWRDTSYQGSPVIKTPSLDAMVANGIRFDYFYPAQQMCSPGRFALLTGRNPYRTGLHALGAMRPEEITVAQTLKTAGYSTAHFGKWHLGAKETHPIRMGFDLSYFSINYFDVGGSLAVNDTAEKVEIKGDSSVFTMGLAIDWIKKKAPEKKPFFAYVCFGSPHSPYKGTPELAAKFKDAPGKADYWAEVAGVDEAVGNLRQSLRDLNLADNTLIFFCSDNGGVEQLSRDPAGGGKMQIGVRTVACAEWPAGVPKPIRTDIVATHADFYPTVLDITGIKPPPGQPVVDGASLLPMLQGKMNRREKPLGFMLGLGDGGIAQTDFTKETHGVWIDGVYKLKITPPGMKVGKKKQRDVAAQKKADGAEVVELYDIYADPTEKKNLAAELPQQVEKMRTGLNAWRQSVRDSYDYKDFPNRAKPATGA